jgi:hypothetical protein
MGPASDPNWFLGSRFAGCGLNSPSGLIFGCSHFLFVRLYLCLSVVI